MSRRVRLSSIMRRCGFKCIPILSLLLISCASIQTSDAVDEVVRLREKCEEMQTAIEKGYADTYSKGKPSNQARIHKDFEYLLTPSKLEVLDRRLASSTEPSEKDAVKRLRRFLIAKNIGFKLAGVTDAALNTELETIITSDDTSIPYRHLNWYLANEKDRDARRNIYLSSSRAFEADNVFYGQQVTTMNREIKSYGYTDYLAFFSEDRSFDPAAMEAAARGFLADTDSLYGVLLADVSGEQLSLAPGDLRFYDVPQIMRMAQFDPFFTPKNLPETVNKTFAGLGILFKKQGGLSVTLGSNAQIADGAHVFPAFFPLLDVRISQKTIGGPLDYAKLFHAAAVALTYVNTKETIFELKVRGTHAGKEGYGYLFEYLIDDPMWLGEFVKLPADELEAYLRVRAFLRLYEVRAMCGCYLLQLTLLEGPQDVKTDYYEIMGPIVKFGLTDREALQALRQNDFFYVADRLRGLFLEPYLRAGMVKKFGEQWFRSPEAGRFLLSDWAPGLKPGLSSIEKAVDGDALSWKPAVEEILSLVQ